MRSTWHGFFTRRRLRFGLGVVLVLALGGVGVQLVRNQWAQHLRHLGVGELDFLPEVAQRIQNFRRVKMEGDRKAWEVAAREAQYFEDDQQIRVDDPEVSFYIKGDQGVVAVKGDKGTIFLSGREMDRVELDGRIEVKFRDYVVTTDRAVYERASDTVVSPAPVHIVGSGFTLSGARMTMEMEGQRVRLDGKVSTVLSRDGRGDAGPL